MISKPSRRIQEYIKKLKLHKRLYVNITGAVFVVVFAAIGAHLLFATHAATPSLATNLNSQVPASTNPAIAPATSLIVTDSTPTQALLNWTASTYANVTSYTVFQNGVKIATTNSLTTVYLATNLNPTTTYTYTVSAQVNNFEAAASNPVSVTTTALNTLIPISSCGTTISTPGNYILTGELTGTQGYCINVTNTNGISINCQGNTINDDVGGMYLPGGINMSGDTNFLVTNCSFLGYNNAYNSPLTISSSQYGAVYGNTFGNTSSVSNRVYMELVSTKDTGLDVVNNMIYDGYIAASQFTGSSSPPVGYGDNYDIINGNTITSIAPSDSVTPAQGCILIAGSNNISAYNTLNGLGGNSTGSYNVSSGNYGTDDGYDLGDNGITSANNKIEYNTMENFFDTGIETTGFNTDDTISNNRISNAAYSGIGGWYWNSWLGNTVNDNTVTNTGYLFSFYVYLAIPTNQTIDYFENNSFTGNSWTVGSYGVFYSAWFNINAWVPTSELGTSNNSFTDNNFTATYHAPIFAPTSMAVDGGANVCSSASSATLKCYLTPTPTTPVLTAGSSSKTSIFLSWPASVDPGGPAISGYNIYSGSKLINAKLISKTDYKIKDLKTGTSYSYQVQAVDVNGSTSPLSNTESINL